MKTENVSAQNFNGVLYVVNKLSSKPAQCILKEKTNLLELIKKEKFDLFIKQDYSANRVNIVATTKSEPQISASNDVLVTANHSQYLETAQKTVENYKTVREDYFWNAYEKSRTFKDKFSDFMCKVLSALVWGK